MVCVHVVVAVVVVALAVYVCTCMHVYMAVRVVMRRTKRNRVPGLPVISTSAVIYIDSLRSMDRITSKTWK